MLLLHAEKAGYSYWWEEEGTEKAEGWKDPLNFHGVPIHEAIARINKAGFFVLKENGDIYKVEANGKVLVQKKEGFNNLFANRSVVLTDKDGNTKTLLGASRHNHHQLAPNQGGYSADLILNILAWRREPIARARILTPERCASRLLFARIDNSSFQQPPTASHAEGMTPLR